MPPQGRPDRRFRGGPVATDGRAGPAGASRPAVRGGLDVGPGPAGRALGSIVAWYSIIHTPLDRLHEVFAEFHRVLAPGGHVLLAFQVGDEPLHLAQPLGHPVSLDFHRRQPDQVAELLGEAALVVGARLVRERILTGQRLGRILVSSAMMAAGTLAVLGWAPGPEPEPGERSTAGTMAFVTFVFFQAFNLLNVCNPVRSVVNRETLANRSAFIAPGAVILLVVLVVEMDRLNGFFTTTDLTSDQWLACAAVGSAILWAGEIYKAVLRARRRCRTS